MDFEIVSLNNSDFINYIENNLNKKIIRVKSGKFADSETYIEPLDVSLKNKNVFVIQQFSFDNKSINDQIAEFLFFTDLIKKSGAKKIYAHLPYLPYSRQAKYFGSDILGPVNLLGKIFKAASINFVFSFELHEGAIKNIFEVPLVEISLIQFGVDFFNKNKGKLFADKDICFVSPDEGRANFIEKIAKMAGRDFAYVKKERKDKDKAVAKQLVGEVKNKNVIIIDDIIDTGNTAIGACDLLLDNGAKSVTGFFAHAVLSKDSVKKMDESGFEDIFITDAVLIGDKLKESKKIKQTSLAYVFVDYFKDKFL
ncbi:ribose-phosphate diphosphokinase [Candidatus Dependentiae bacterium]|nr:ribose-phosphate diphosphokinase [Candidatus Dependentiae bacterium]